jgi:hypothetical protein
MWEEAMAKIIDTSDGGNAGDGNDNDGERDLGDRATAKPDSSPRKGGSLIFSTIENSYRHLF